MSINYNTSEYDKKYIEWLKEENRRLAEQLGKQIKWHLFPEEKPPRDDFYIITVDGKDQTYYGYWFSDDNCWSNEDAVKIGCEDWLAYEWVSAWAEFPKPHKREKQNER